MRSIPVCTPVLGNKEYEYVVDCLRTNWISSSGKYIDWFEEKFSRYCEKKYGITTTNGTSALHLALNALRIGQGDEVIMPSFTIASTVFAAIYCGAKPVLVDSKSDTWNIDVSQIEKKITQKTKAIMPVHIYGHPCDMDPIIKLAKKYKLYVIEDAAEAHGAQYYGKKVGGIGDVGCFSFYGNKIITCGEGGMVVTSNRKIAERCRLLKNLAFLKTKRFFHKEIGYNYRMTNLQAALGLAQLEKIDKFIAKRRDDIFFYNSQFRDIPGLTLPVEKKGMKNVYWMYGLLVGKEFGMTRDQLMKKLSDRGIETRTFFIPLHRQPVLKKMGLVSGERFPVAEAISRQGLYLPSGNGLKREDREYVCETIKRLQKNAS